MRLISAISSTLSYMVFQPYQGQMAHQLLVQQEGPSELVSHQHEQLPLQQEGQVWPKAFVV